MAISFQYIQSCCESERAFSPLSKIRRSFCRNVVCPYHLVPATGERKCCGCFPGCKNDQSDEAWSIYRHCKYCVWLPESSRGGRNRRVYTGSLACIMIKACVCRSGVCMLRASGAWEPWHLLLLCVHDLHSELLIPSVGLTRHSAMVTNVGNSCAACD